jgi:hypothetical protein
MKVVLQEETHVLNQSWIDGEQKSETCILPARNNATTVI